VTDVTGEEAFDSRQEGGHHPQAEEHQTRCGGQEGRSHEEAQDHDREEVDAQEEHQARCGGQEGRGNEEAQDRREEGDAQAVDGPQVDSQVDRIEADLRAQARDEEEDDPSQVDQKEGRDVVTRSGILQLVRKGGDGPPSSFSHRLATVPERRVLVSSVAFARSASP
jgi:hypothetical protein